MKPVIVTCFPAEPRHLERIQMVAGDAELWVADDQSIRDLLPQATVLCGHIKTPVDWEATVNAGKLQWIQSTAAGIDHCLVPAVVNSPIVVSSASGVFADQVAEQALALLLGLLRGLPRFFRAGLERQFRRLPTDDLHGKTVAILGFGGNGRRIAEVLKPFGCRLIATDCFPDAETSNDVSLFSANALHDVVADADIVILTLPLTTATYHLIDARCLNAMKRGAYVINVGRGATVDEQALTTCLQDGHLAGAGLDVFEHEPLSIDSPLWDLPNVIITPHVGAQAARRLDDVTQLFCRNLVRRQNGERLWNQVDKQLGFPLPADRLPTDWRIG